MPVKVSRHSADANTAQAETDGFEHFEAVHNGMTGFSGKCGFFIIAFELFFDDAVEVAQNRVILRGQLCEVRAGSDAATFVGFL